MEAALGDIADGFADGCSDALAARGPHRLREPTAADAVSA
jgi:hypothetical protein